jgi:hypothetical protein
VSDSGFRVKDELAVWSSVSEVRVWCYMVDGEGFRVAQG